MRGFVNISKPKGMTSSDVVVKVRGILRRATGAKHKVGHFGTLDPMGTGVLPIAIGTATRLFDYCAQKVKVYQTTFKFGSTTDTLDCDGKEVESGCYVPTRYEIESVLAEFIGEFDQIPPQFSAKSIDGKRAYKYAREGIEVELKPKKIEIFDIKLISSDDGKYVFTTKAKNQVESEIMCSNIGASCANPVQNVEDEILYGGADINCANHVRPIDDGTMCSGADVGCLYSLQPNFVELSNDQKPRTVADFVVDCQQKDAQATFVPTIENVSENQHKIAQENFYLTTENVLEYQHEMAQENFCLTTHSIIANQNETVQYKCCEYGEYALEIVCGGGTYIRSIVRDIAKRLDTVGHMTSIHRIKSGTFTIAETVNLSDFEKSPLDYMLPMEIALKEFAVFDLPENDADKILNGIKISYDNLPEGDFFVVKRNDEIVAMAKNIGDCLSLTARI